MCPSNLNNAASCGRRQVIGLNYTLNSAALSEFFDRRSENQLNPDLDKQQLRMKERT
jgi:hypothetical protein